MWFYIANASVDFAVLTIIVSLCNYTMNATTSPPPPSSAITTVISTGTPPPPSSAITTVISTGTPAMIIPLALLAVCLTLGV